MATPLPVWDLRAELGEGPVWDERDKALWFTDIKRQKIHRYDPATGARRSWDSPEQAGFVLPAQGGGFAAGMQSGLYRFVPENNEFHGIVAVEPDLRTNRINDGAVDPSDRLWFGTMDNGEREKTGAFYCFANGELRRTGLDGIAITNGPAISPDGRTLYWVDTLGGTMSACEIGDDGELGPSRLVVKIPPKEGYPDGPTVDSEGCIWLSLYGGWEARRYSPDGELLMAVRFPVANITKLAFGGPGLRTAFATTARQLLKPDALEAQPLAGALFQFAVEVPGIPCPLVRM
jgi:sugar lactone lactonase YvrE